jgi:RimJ/RimL family protein N-acetyltransferase
MLVEFSTARVLLRPMAEADEALFCDLYSDVETMRFIGPPLSRERASRGFRNMLRLMRRPAADQVFFTLNGLASDARVAGATLGFASIQHVDVPARRAEAGVVIGSQYRDRGFAREVLSGLIRFAFERLDLDEIWVQIHADHTVVEKLVVSVGLSRGSSADAYDSDAVMRIWSARRATWLHERDR